METGDSVAPGAGEGESRRDWEGTQGEQHPREPGGRMESACSAHRITGLDPAELHSAAGVSRTLSVCYSRIKMPKCLELTTQGSLKLFQSSLVRMCPQEALSG